ncbi:class I SAM-dependent methyltransferase [Blastococcus litoris]|uniref:class I SAM-dependent methyltransferase n=1 Tax=Blastococcus litoris TaxID=2171622 RepID=UPI000E305293|nr:class I SAM-dependent methyltransferase [Blastococcus litoris]
MDAWSSGESYDAYVGRWSRLVAARFVDWLGRPAGQRWLDVGCGTGALTGAVLTAAEPAAVVGIDPSPGFVQHAAAAVADPRASFEVGDARALPVPDGVFDAAVSGLVLNFVAERTTVLREMRRAVGPGGTVAAYVWDYAGGMQLMTAYWDAVLELGLGDPAESEAVRFGFCRPEALRTMATAAGLTDVGTTEIVVPTEFRDFDDFWSPFLGGTGSAPAHLASLPETDRTRVRDAVRERLPAGEIRLTARAWAVRGTAP